MLFNLALEACCRWWDVVDHNLLAVRDDMAALTKGQESITAMG